MKPKLVVIVGPTAVGKTKTSIEIARTFNGEIINSDSMQVYKGMDIGTAKVKQREMQGVPHHLLDFKNPTEAYTAVDFQSDARQTVEEIHRRKKVPVMVGGTGLYIRALTHNYEFNETQCDPDYRKELEQFVHKQGVSALHNQLKTLDPTRAADIHPNNVRRVIRALEVYKAIGSTTSPSDQAFASPYELATVGLTMEREHLYERINLRVDLMIEEGLFSEVQALFDAGVQNTQAVQAIGYKEIYEYFKGNCTREEAIHRLKRNSRRYAKRQLTWFRHQMDVEWFDVTNRTIDEKIPSILRFVAGKLNFESN